MELIQKILSNGLNLKEDKWFYPEDLLSEYGIYEVPDFTDNRLKKMWFESWICTDTEVGIAVYFLDGEMVCVSWQPYRKSSEEFWFISGERGRKLKDYFFSLLRRDEDKFRLLDEVPDLEEMSSKIEYKKFEFSALNS